METLTLSQLESLIKAYDTMNKINGYTGNSHLSTLLAHALDGTPEATISGAVIQVMINELIRDE